MVGLRLLDEFATYIYKNVYSPFRGESETGCIFTETKNRGERI